MHADWLELLNRVKNGDVSVEEAAQRMDEFERGGVENVSSPAASLPAPARAETDGPARETEPSLDIGRWGEAWLIPFWIGTGILVLGAMLMGWAYSSQRSFWIFCSWLPMLLGLLVLFLGWWSRNARWVHVRVQEAGGNRVSISMPLPLRLAGWALRVFGPMIPQVREQKLEFLPDILDAVSETRDPITVDVDDKNGDRVKVYIL